MQIRIRLLVISAAVFVFSLLLGVSQLAGHETGGNIAVVQISELRTDVVTYGLVDLDHGFFTQRSITVPGFGGSNFGHVPPLVLQSARNGDTTTWTLNALDPWSGALTPEMRIEADNGKRLNVTMFSQRASDRWIYRDLFADELYITRAGEINGLRPDIPDASIFWSNDFAQFAVETEGVVTITDFETGETDVIMEDARQRSVMVWSPDSRHIAVSSLVASKVTWRIINVERREAAAELQTAGLRWCDDRRLYYTSSSGDGLYHALLYDLETGTEDAFLTRDLSHIPVPAQMLAVLDLRGYGCDWLQLFTGTQAGRETVELVHVESGKTIPFAGIIIGFYTVADGALIYRVEDGRTTELRRIVLDPATESYELLASLDMLSTSLTWIDDTRGAVYVKNGQLRRIDRDTGKEILLPGVEIQIFQRIP